ncbi:MAG: hypothetical protein [Circular genetic element sp.]|nr:MAG: hypothetical protein [Circular genetic element sp.]
MGDGGNYTYDSKLGKFVKKLGAGIGDAEVQAGIGLGNILAQGFAGKKEYALPIFMHDKIGPALGMQEANKKAIQTKLAQQNAFGQRAGATTDAGLNIANQMGMTANTNDKLAQVEAQDAEMLGNDINRVRNAENIDKDKYQHHLNTTAQIKAEAHNEQVASNIAKINDVARIASGYASTKAGENANDITGIFAPAKKGELEDVVSEELSSFIADRDKADAAETKIKEEATKLYEESTAGGFTTTKDALGNYEVKDASGKIDTTKTSALNAKFKEYTASQDLAKKANEAFNKEHMRIKSRVRPTQLLMAQEESRALKGYGSKRYNKNTTEAIDRFRQQLKQANPYANA